MGATVRRGSNDGVARSGATTPRGTVLGPNDSQPNPTAPVLKDELTRKSWINQVGSAGLNSHPKK